MVRRSSRRGSAKGLDRATRRQIRVGHPRWTQRAFVVAALLAITLLLDTLVRVDVLDAAQPLEPEATRNAGAHRALLAVRWRPLTNVRAARSCVHVGESVANVTAAHDGSVRFLIDGIKALVCLRGGALIRNSNAMTSSIAVVRAIRSVRPRDSPFTSLIELARCQGRNGFRTPQSKCSFLGGAQDHATCGSPQIVRCSSAPLVPSPHGCAGAKAKSPRTRLYENAQNDE